MGTFDEAFKSRIQVALYYDRLGIPARRKVWQNFFDMMEVDQEEMDSDGLRLHLSELADHEMNGRQIRNVVTTARQLATFKKERLEWTHLQQSIKVASDFNRYLTSVHGHEDDQWAREEKLR